MPLLRHAHSRARTEVDLIASFFASRSTGYFLDVGAYDGIAYSNTRSLWQRGWSGTLIEPDPITFARLRATYTPPTRVTLVNAALVPDSVTSDTVSFYRHSDSSHSGWHSTSHEWAATWPQDASYAIAVGAVRFRDLHLPPHIDLLSLDTEGTDAALLRSLPATLRPSLILIEVDKRGARREIEAEMKRRGYVFLWGTSLNSAYAALAPICS